MLSIHCHLLSINHCMPTTGCHRVDITPHNQTKSQSCQWSFGPLHYGSRSRTCEQRDCPTLATRTLFPDVWVQTMCTISCPKLEQLRTYGGTNRHTYVTLARPFYSLKFHRSKEVQGVSRSTKSGVPALAPIRHCRPYTIRHLCQVSVILWLCSIPCALLCTLG